MGKSFQSLMENWLIGAEFLPVRLLLVVEVWCILYKNWEYPRACFNILFTTNYWHKILKSLEARRLGKKQSYPFEIWQAPQQECWWDHIPGFTSGAIINTSLMPFPCLIKHIHTVFSLQIYKQIPPPPLQLILIAHSPYMYIYTYIYISIV